MEFVDVQELTNLMHEFAINLTALIAEQGNWHSESAEYLFYQDLGNCLSFFVPDGKRFDPFSERVYASKNVHVSASRPRVWTGQVDRQTFKRCAGDDGLQRR